MLADYIDKCAKHFTHLRQIGKRNQGTHFHPHNYQCQETYPFYRLPDSHGHGLYNSQPDKVSFAEHTASQWGKSCSV